MKYQLKIKSMMFAVIMLAISPVIYGASPTATIYEEGDGSHLVFVKLGKTKNQNLPISYMDFDGKPNAYAGNHKEFYAAFGPGLYSYQQIDHKQWDVQEISFGRAFQSKIDEGKGFISDLKLTSSNNLLVLFEGGENSLFDNSEKAFVKIDFTRGELNINPIANSYPSNIYLFKDHAFFPDTITGSIFVVDAHDDNFKPCGGYQESMTARDLGGFKDFCVEGNYAYGLYEKALRIFEFKSDDYQLSFSDEIKLDEIYTHLISYEDSLFLINSKWMNGYQLDEGRPVLNKTCTFTGMPTDIKRVFTHNKQVFIATDTSLHSFSLFAPENNILVAPQLPEGGKVLDIH